ncbi:hypothetical protein MASR1M60_19670 [Rhodocyclaceae bacterium]
MNTSAKTEPKSTPNDPAHDLDPAGGKAKGRKYRGKYPEQIKTVSGGYREGAWHCTVETNGGAVFEFVKRHNLANSPQTGQEIEDWILHLDPINDAADQIARKYLFNA